ncbi:uncharacterized protein TRIVIDRAFT_34884, partial [Trichoderma virens Gv29-8]
YQTDDDLFISMEYFPLGNLHEQTLLKQSDPLAEGDVVNIIQQVVRALRFMHNEGFAHRDLKPANIMLVSRQPEWRVKLIDFGNSKRFNKETEKVSAIIGTNGYIAPDILDYAIKYQHSSSINPEESITQDVWLAGDIWSLGETVFQLISKKPSFPFSRNLMEYFHGKAAFPIEKLESFGYSSEAMDFVQSAMKAKPDSRMTIHDAAAHAWLKMTDSRPSSKVVSNTM